MLLRALVEYAARAEPPPAMYVEGEVHWALEISGSGAYEGWTPLRDAAGRGQLLLRPHAARSSAVRPKLLADTVEYVLGVPRPTSRPDRVRAQHAAFVTLVEQAAAATKHPGVIAAASFYQAGGEVDLPEGGTAADVVTLRVDGHYPMDDPVVREFWARYTSDAADRVATPCLVCGRVAVATERLPLKIKGIPGGQPSGTALVSVNDPTFESYGRKAALNSPICANCAEASHNALNTLIAGAQTHLNAGPVVYVFWTRDRDDTFSPVALLDAPSPEDVRELLRSAWTGDERGNALIKRDGDRFYACALSANGGRAVVRTWLDTTVGQTQRHLARWFAGQDLVAEDGHPGTPLGIRALTDALYRDRRDLVPSISTDLITSALSGAPVNPAVLVLALRRSRVDRDHVPRARAVVIKLALVSLGQGGSNMEERLSGLDPHYPDPAYHWGRLVAELESIQRAAVPGANSTLIDRYFGAASTAPGRIYSVLIRNAQPHLAKLRRDNERQYYGHQRRLEEIQTELAPNALSQPFDINQQGLFALGYYHQRADQRRQMLEARHRHDESTPEEAAQA
jgi:CRISPR-associated protein Csd1